MFIVLKLCHLIFRKKIFLKFRFFWNFSDSEYFILSPNHLSVLDIVVVLGCLNWKQFRSIYFVTRKSNIKDTLRKLIIMLFCADIIYIDKKEGNIILSQVALARKKISLYIHPEGKISKTGELLSFDRGMAFLSLKSNLPVIPVLIKGTNKVTPHGTYEFNPCPVEIIFGEPIDPVHFLKDTNNGLNGIVDLTNRYNQKLFDELLRMKNTY